jgi:hypothetical protein
MFFLFKTKKDTLPTVPTIDDNTVVKISFELEGKNVQNYNKPEAI